MLQKCLRNKVEENRFDRSRNLEMEARNNSLRSSCCFTANFKGELVLD